MATSVSKNSKDIYTINNIKNAIIELCGYNSQSGVPTGLSESLKEDRFYADTKQKAIIFFNALKKNKFVALCLTDRDKTTEIRSNSVITSGTGLLVAARVGGYILNNLDDAEIELNSLFNMDWSRSNPLFVGRIVTPDQKILNARETITSAVAALKRNLSYPLTEAELLKV